MLNSEISVLEYKRDELLEVQGKVKFLCLSENEIFYIYHGDLNTVAVNDRYCACVCYSVCVCVCVCVRERERERARESERETGDSDLLYSLYFSNQQVSSQDFVASFNKRVWLGLTDRDTEGSFQWVDGTNLTSPT